MYINYLLAMKGQMTISPICLQEDSLINSKFDDVLMLSEYFCEVQMKFIVENYLSHSALDTGKELIIKTNFRRSF